MFPVRSGRFLPLLLLFLFSLPASAQDRCAIWVDLYFGEPIEFTQMLDDLATVQVIYLGESHRLARHHELQTEIVQSLAKSGKKVLLGLEQLEAFHQEHVDRYNRGEIDFDELAEAIRWHERWANYEDYRSVVEAARQGGGRIVALNARAETIRSIGRSGIDSVTGELRSELPAEMNFDDPLYERWLNRQLLVHMHFSEEMLRSVYLAQVARDEMMAQQMANAWQQLDDPESWVGVVICGAGHCAYNLGTPPRLQRRLPGLRERIVLMSESGDVELTSQEQAMAREITITHEDIRFLNQPIADYLHLMPAAPEEP